MNLNVISFSEVYKWDTCHRQWYYRFDLGLKPIEESNAINTGIKGHGLLQFFYRALKEGKTKEEAWEITRRAANLLIKNESMTERAALLVAWTLVDNYIRDTDFTSKAVLVENRFLIPVSAVVSSSIVDAYRLQDVQIGFTPDVMFNREGNFYDVEDAKFVGRAWPKKKLDMFQQAKLYQIFLRRMGYDVSLSVIRFFNVTTGKITVKNDPLTIDEEKIILDDFLDAVQEVNRYKKSSPEQLKRTRRTANYTTCQFCAFAYPCHLERQGKNATMTLENEYTKSDYDYSS